MDPTLDFSDNNDTPADLDRQAEVRLEHMFDMLRAYPSFANSSGGNTALWENEVIRLELTTDSLPDGSQQRFTVRRLPGTSRYVEALAASFTLPTGEVRTAYAVRRIEDGWTVEYPLGQSQDEAGNYPVRAWQTDPAAANPSPMPPDQFHARTNAILADLQSGISRLSSSSGTPPQSAVV